MVLVKKMNLKELSGQNPIADPLWTFLITTVAAVSFSFPQRTTFVLEGEENLPTTSVIFAPNHSHKYDFLPLRSQLVKRNMHLVTWIKSRAYKDPVMAKVLGKSGNIPLSSRGYLISADFENVVGRRPSEEEYRHLRAHVDDAEPLPEGDVWKEILSTPRDMLGVFFDPQKLSYRDALRELYYKVMQATLELARQCMSVGHHMHFYPQGAVSSRLTPGKVGIIEAALALDIPIIPVGISGCREAFVGQSPRTRKGTITMRIGEPITIDKTPYGPDFRPFHPNDEDSFHARLQADTDRVMDRINALVDPAYQQADDAEYDGKVGIERFY